LKDERQNDELRISLLDSRRGHSICPHSFPHHASQIQVPCGAIVEALASDLTGGDSIHPDQTDMVTEIDIQQRKRELEEKQPCRKQKFETAENALLDLKKKNQVHKKKLTGVYLCKNCGNWHLTSIPKKKALYFKHNPGDFTGKTILV